MLTCYDEVVRAAPAPCRTALTLFCPKLRVARRRRLRVLRVDAWRLLVGEMSFRGSMDQPCSPRISEVRGRRQPLILRQKEKRTRKNKNGKAIKKALSLSPQKRRDFDLRTTVRYSTGVSSFVHPVAYATMHSRRGARGRRLIRGMTRDTSRLGRIKRSNSLLQCTATWRDCTWGAVSLDRDTRLHFHLGSL